MNHFELGYHEQFQIIIRVLLPRHKGKQKIGIAVNQGEILIVHVHYAALPVHQLVVCPLSRIA
jgi:hypothetical protein